jgi:hypothetical protein
MFHRTNWLVATALLSSALLATGCGDDKKPGTGSTHADAATTDGQDGSSVDGSAIDGSGDATTTDTPPALPLMEVSTTTVDFGALACGGSSAAEQGFTVKNTGTAALSVTGVLPAQVKLGACTVDKGTCDVAAFKLAVDPGGTATLTLQLQPPAKSSKAGDKVEAKVTLTGNDATHASADIAVKASTSGATLVATPAAVSFGATPVGGKATQAVAIHNDGNAAVSIDLTAPENKAFAIAVAGNATPTAIEIAAGATVTVDVTFTPTAAGNTSGTLNATAKGATCGESLTSLALTGEGTIGAIGVSTAVLDFGKVNCGTTASVQKVTLQNTGKAAYSFTALLKQGSESPFTVAPASGKIEAGQAAEVTVTPKQIPGTSAVSSNGFGDTLTLGTDIPGDAPHLVDVKETAQGAILSFSQASVPFGNIPVSSTQSSALTLSNAGNSSATVTIASDNAVFLANPASATVVAAGGNLPFSLSFSPKDTTEQKGVITVKLATGEALCSPLPAGVQVSGQGTNGGVALSANSVDFGFTDCGTTATSKTVTLTNSGNAPLKWTALLGKNPSPYSLSQPSFGSLAAGAKVDIVLTPGAIPQTSTTAVDAFADALTISTDVTNDNPHVIPLHQTAHGAVLALNPTALDFGNVPVTKTSTAAFDVVNTGNGAASYTLTSDNPTFTVAGPVQVAGGASSTLTATFAPGNSATTQNGKVALGVAPSTVLCSPLPSALQVTGTGTTGAITISPASLNFGNVNCGASAGPKTVTISNGGTAAFNLKTPVLGKGADASYTVALSATSVPPGGAVTMTVTPKAIPAQSATTPNLYGDSITLETDIAGDTTHLVGLSETAEGAIFAISTSTLTFSNTPVGATTTTQFTVTNTGNHPTPVSFVVANPVFAIAGQTVQGNSSYFANATFSPSAAQSYNDNATFTIPAGSPLCAPLPAAIAMNGKGVTGGVLVGPSTLQFGYVPCGAQQSAKQVTFKNGTGLDFTWSASLNKGASSPYSVAPTSGTVKAGETLTLTVTPAKIPATSTTQADAYGDVLTVTTTAQGNESLTVPLHMTALGAILALSPSSLDFGLVKANKNSKSLQFNLINSGNLAAGVTVSATGNAMFTASVGSTQVSGNGGVAQGTATFAPTGAGQAKASLKLETQTGLCAPLPTGIDFMTGLGF